MNDLPNTHFYEQLHNDAWSFYITFCGILLSILTLLYSFIASKRTELKIYSGMSKCGDTDPIVNKQQILAIRYINKLKLPTPKVAFECGKLQFLFKTFS